MNPAKGVGRNARPYLLALARRQLRRVDYTPGRGKNQRITSQISILVFYRSTIEHHLRGLVKGKAGVLRKWLQGKGIGPGGREKPLAPTRIGAKGLVGDYLLAGAETVIRSLLASKILSPTPLTFFKSSMAAKGPFCSR